MSTINRYRLLLITTLVGSCGLYYNKSNKHGFSNGIGLGSLYYHMHPLIHKFIDPEKGHNLAIRCLSQPHCVRRYMLGLTDLQPDPPNLACELFNHKFNNPIGLAAGFDKNGEAIQGISEQGFGFVEIGSVTPLPQFGNEKPRLFRLTEDNAVINRYGFNSLGAEAVKNNLENLEQKVNKPIILGINLGINKFSDVKDYILGIRNLSQYADYLVINISSPNTPGLRDLHGKKDLTELLKNCKSERDRLYKQIPLLLKISPDLSEQDKLDICEAIQFIPIDGLIISNTTTERPNTLKSQFRNERGGLSGAPLFNISTELISEFYQKTKGNVPIIGVGGIETAEQAYTKIKAGASLVQIYSAYSLQGPRLIAKIKKELSELVEADGYKSIQEAVGTQMFKVINK